MTCCCLTSTETVVKVGNDAVEHFPVRDRKCQDIPFVLLFILFIIGLIAGISVAACQGDIDRIINGLDSFGNVCGKMNTLVIPGIKVNDGPKDKTKKTKVSLGEIMGPSHPTQCVEKCRPDDMDFLNRCIPKNITSRDDKGRSNVLSVTSKTATSFFKQAAGDIQFSWEQILYLCIGATFLTLFVIFLLRYAAKVIIYVTMVVMIIVSTAAVGYIWYKYYKVIENRKDQVGAVSASTMRMRQARERTWLAGGAISTILWFFFLLMLWILRKRIALVVALFVESGKALTAIPCLMIQPFWTFLWLVLILCLWVYAIMWIQSSGYFEVADKLSNPRAYLVQGPGTQFIKWYYVFGLLWLTWFCFGCQNLVIAGAVVKWFFTRDKSKLGSPIIEATRITIRYHLGSVAVGSLIISLLRFVRLLFHFIQRNMANSHSPSLVCCFTMCQCCVKCFESFLKYLTRNAYIEIAIYGSDFCTAAKKAFQIITSNAMNITAINSVGDFALFLCKATIVVIVAAVGVGVLGNKDGIVHKWVPIVMACFFSYLIADCFLSVFEMTIDTTFMCFCEDLEINDGINRPYFMSASLMRFVEDSNKTMYEMAVPKPQPAA